MVMSKIRTHIKSIRHILLVWFVLFSLSPCTVKEAVSGSLKAAYAKPLNSSKTSVPVNSCAFNSVYHKHVSIAKKTDCIKHIEPAVFYGNLYFQAPVKIRSGYSKTFSGNSPPKYILYRRLKIGRV